MTAQKRIARQSGIFTGDVPPSDAWPVTYWVQRQEGESKMQAVERTVKERGDWQKIIDAGYSKVIARHVADETVKAGSLWLHSLENAK